MTATRAGWVGDSRGGGIGTIGVVSFGAVGEDDREEERELEGEFEEERAGAAVMGAAPFSCPFSKGTECAPGFWGITRAPDQASRRRINVANPSFQPISFRSRRWRFRLRACIDAPSESGVSNLYGLITDVTKDNFDAGGDWAGGESESESRAR